MNWSDAARLVEAVQETVTNEETKRALYAQFIDIFRDVMDDEELCEIEGVDSVFDELLEEVGVLDDPFEDDEY